MFSRNELCVWYCYLALFVVLGFLQSLVYTAFDISIANHTSTFQSTLPGTTSPTYSIYLTPTLNSQATFTQTMIRPSVSSVRGDHGTTIIPSSTDVVRASVSRVHSTPTTNTKPPNKLSSFGIVMLVIGGLLIVGMFVCLLVICCRGRERGPEGTHVPHSNVKMKPWKSSEISTANELTEDSVDVLDTTNHFQSHQNSGLTNSPQISSTLSPPSANNNISTPTGTFRNLQTHSHVGDLGEFGRKLSLGRQAYEPNVTPQESTAEREPAIESKGEQDDMTTIHYV